MNVNTAGVTSLCFAFLSSNKQEIFPLRKSLRFFCSSSNVPYKLRERVRINREFEWNTCLTNWYFVSFPLIHCAQAQQRVFRCERAEINGGFTYLTSSLMPRYGFCRIIFTRQTFDFTGRKLQSSQHPEHTRIIICVSIDSNGIL